MPKGLVFVWAPKDLVSELLLTMEKKDFLYVENLEIINLDFERAKDIALGPQKARPVKRTLGLIQLRPSSRRISGPSSGVSATSTPAT